MTDPFVQFHASRILGTFAGLSDCKIALAHIDVDIYQAHKDCLEFIYPRLVPGGFIIFDDYGMHSCPGARRAADEFFAERPERPLALASAQAVIFKMDTERAQGRP